MAPLRSGVLLAALAAAYVCASARAEDATPGKDTPEETTTHAADQAPEAGISTPRLIVQYVDGKGFNISIPNAGQEMQEFKYYVVLNEPLEGAASVVHRGRVECFNDKSRFRLARDRELKEGDTLRFYLIGFRKPEGFQMERSFELKKDDSGVLEFQQISEKVGLQKEGIWYPNLDKTNETNP